MPSVIKLKNICMILYQAYPLVNFLLETRVREFLSMRQKIYF